MMKFDQRLRCFRPFTEAEKRTIRRQYLKQLDTELQRGPVTMEEMMDDDSADHNHHAV